MKRGTVRQSQSEDAIREKLKECFLKNETASKEELFRDMTGTDHGTADFWLGAAHADVVEAVRAYNSSRDPAAATAAPNGGQGLSSLRSRLRKTSAPDPTRRAEDLDSAETAAHLERQEAEEADTEAARVEREAAEAEAEEVRAADATRRAREDDEAARRKGAVAMLSAYDGGGGGGGRPPLAVTVADDATPGEILLLEYQGQRYAFKTPEDAKAGDLLRFSAPEGPPAAPPRDHDASTSTLLITVPEGAVPGEIIAVEYNGKDFKVKVPEGSKPGDALSFDASASASSPMTQVTAVPLEKSVELAPPSPPARLKPTDDDLFSDAAQKDHFDDLFGDGTAPPLAPITKDDLDDLFA